MKAAIALQVKGQTLEGRPYIYAPLVGEQELRQALISTQFECLLLNDPAPARTQIARALPQPATGVCNRAQIEQLLAQLGQPGR